VSLGGRRTAPCSRRRGCRVSQGRVKGRRLSFHAVSATALPKDGGGGRAGLGETHGASALADWRTGCARTRGGETALSSRWNSYRRVPEQGSPVLVLSLGLGAHSQVVPPGGLDLGFRLGGCADVTIRAFQLADRLSADAGPSGADPRPLRRGEVGAGLFWPGSAGDHSLHVPVPATPGRVSCNCSGTGQVEQSASSLLSTFHKEPNHECS
jgi:hypothetical protein